MSLPRPVNQLDYETGVIIKSFKSMREVSDFHDIETQSIRYAIKHCEGKMKIRRLRFAYAGEEGQVRKVEQIDYFTDEHIELYNSANVAAIDNYLDPHTLRLALKNDNGIIHRRQLKFRYLDS